MRAHTALVQAPGGPNCSGELALMTQGSAVHAALMLIITIIITIINDSSRATRRWPDCSGELALMTQGSAGAHSLAVYVYYYY